MKMTAKLVSLTFLLLCSASAQERQSLAGLDWLAGCWQMNLKGRVVDEQWMKSNGNMMMGMSRTVKEGKTLEYEFIRIVQNADSIYYVAKPSGQEGASFRLMKLETNTIVFENRAHDFPQRIIYHRVSQDSLIARI